MKELTLLRIFGTIFFILGFIINMINSSHAISLVGPIIGRFISGGFISATGVFLLIGSFGGFK